MATAVVTKPARAEKSATTTAPRKSSRGRTKRRIKNKVSMLSLVVLFFATLMLPFAYTNIYANLKMAGYSRSDCESKFEAARIENQRLQVDVAIHSSPGRIRAEAARLHMIAAAKYDYLDQPQTVASR